MNVFDVFDVNSIKNVINIKCHQKCRAARAKHQIRELPFCYQSTNYASNMLYWSIRFRDSFGTDKTSVTSADRTFLPILHDAICFQSKSNKNVFNKNRIVFEMNSM